MAEEQAVLIHLDGLSLPDAVYEQYDLATLEDDLIAAMDSAGTGELDGNEVGPEGAILFLYGPDAAALLASIEPILHASPLCQNARIVLRAGDPGAPETEVRLPLHG